MNPRIRKLIGMIVLVALVVVYAVVAVTVAVATLSQSPWWVHMLYFAVTGLLWILPAMLIIKWMAKPAASR